MAVLCRTTIMQVSRPTIMQVHEKIQPSDWKVHIYSGLRFLRHKIEKLGVRAVQANPTKIGGFQCNDFVEVFGLARVASKSWPEGWPGSCYEQRQSTDRSSFWHSPPKPPSSCYGLLNTFTLHIYVTTRDMDTIHWIVNRRKEL